MIVYNNRYRGQFEYEKFAWNIFSLANMMNHIEKIEFQGTDTEFQTLKDINKDINDVFKTITDSNNISDRFYLLLIQAKEDSVL